MKNKFNQTTTPQRVVEITAAAGDLCEAWAAEADGCAREAEALAKIEAEALGERADSTRERFSFEAPDFTLLKTRADLWHELVERASEVLDAANKHNEETRIVTEFGVTKNRADYGRTQEGINNAAKRCGTAARVAEGAVKRVVKAEAAAERDITKRRRAVTDRTALRMEILRDAGIGLDRGQPVRLAKKPDTAGSAETPGSCNP